ncbi:hypothetical protein AWM75_04615 [Aerococcus urinaehominis]|uniref:Cyclic-di-AMP phosphodiesterase n=1 Tax=Aerococcus urinaehominis TaxID=128944 RepID=A0A109RHS3_9LACT|nr:DHH family phosphoesterase [Aerococcus urinaehominis]AMB99326.1 hypothetical protein AWM75_04615 [Aerococcus urinaehominis]SDM20519.1 c-di-AMP phosphodiesterase, consists of a GGDEF-like and DHH domains [Aerococcus urinaehominis]
MKKNIWNRSVSSFLKRPGIMIPLIASLVLAIVVIVLGFYGNFRIGLLIAIVMLLVTLLMVTAIINFVNRNQGYILDLTRDIDSVQNEILLKLPLGILILDENQDVQWLNPFMQQFFYKKEIIGLPLKEMDSEIKDLLAYFEANPETSQTKLAWQDRFFDVEIFREENTLYFLDITDYERIAVESHASRMVLGYVVIDNYDESVSNMTDSRKSTIDNFMTKQLSAWAEKYDSFMKRLDDDRFIMITTYGRLNEMEEDKFSVIDHIREATSKANYPLTVSMGLSYREPGENLNISGISGLAQSNLDLALSRGGDQIVIKTADSPARYYGGKTNPMEKRTHVRARQIATTIANMIQENEEEIFVMGHSYPDMDAIGACLGIRRIARMNGKRCYIVVDQDKVYSDIDRLIKELEKDEDLAADLISPSKASDRIKQNSLLFIVDVHKPSLTIQPDLIDQVNGVVIIDHHRKGEEFPVNVLLEYIEPYASSACELITEFFEYQNPEIDDEGITRIEATTMLAGIIVDTRNFSLRTGSRTFDAASYLKSVGADSILIQTLLKEDLSTYIARSELVESVEFLPPNIGIAAGDNDRAYDAVTAAQAADTLLSVQNIDASYVVFLRNDGRVGISARSLGNVSVQRIMEELGGGGHLSNAATQIPDVTVDQAVNMLKDVIANEMEEE